MSPLPENNIVDIVDAHVHFWNPDKVYIPWVKNTMFDQRMEATQYAEQVQQVKVHSAVFVEADVDPTHALVEAEWIASQVKQAAGYGGIGAIVAYAPVHHGPRVRNFLTLLRSIAGDRLRGVRYLLQDLDPELLRQQDLKSGIRALADFELSFDITINCHKHPEQFLPLIELVQSCPDVQFVLDHMAKPPCDTQPGHPDYEHWKECMTTLGSFTNVVCKVSGLVTETRTQTPDQLRPFVDHARQAFGVDRLMFGSDWPVCESTVPLQKWVNILASIVNEWHPEDKQKLFIDNAKRIYRLD